MTERPELIVDEEPTPQVEDIPPQGPNPERIMEYKPIKSGDTLDEFAARYNTTAAQILADNNITPDLFRFGYWLWV